MIPTTRIAAGAPALVRPRIPRTATLAVAVVTMLLVAGTVLAVGLVAGGASPSASAPVPAGPYGLSQDIPTSFGALAIDGLMRTPVPRRSDEMEAFITLTNLTDDPVPYSPARFHLLVGDGATDVRAMQATFPPGTLRPDANFSGRLRFSAPRDAAKLRIEFTDPRGGKPILIDLGRSGATTPDSAFDRFLDG